MQRSCQKRYAFSVTLESSLLMLLLRFWRERRSLLSASRSPRQTRWRSSAYLSSLVRETSIGTLDAELRIKSTVDSWGTWLAADLGGATISRCIASAGAKHSWSHSRPSKDGHVTTSSSASIVAAMMLTIISALTGLTIAKRRSAVLRES